MKHNFIGDIHGRDNWQQLVKDDCVNVFLGDYFDPYTKTYDDCYTQFNKILELKSKRPETVLLLGNHDCTYYRVGDMTNRIDYEHFNEIADLFAKNKQHFNIVYGCGNVLASHAGVSYVWYLRHVFGSFVMDLPYATETIEEAFIEYAKEQNSMFKADSWTYPNEPNADRVFKWQNDYYFYMYDTKQYVKVNVEIPLIVETINQWWESDSPGKYFNFRNNCGFNDVCGTTPSQSPLWIRFETIVDYNLLSNIPNSLQVVGHTQLEQIVTINGVVGCDCLGTKPDSYTIDI